jgi:hypothetical protein
MEQDLVVVEAMVDEMEDYLKSDVLFWQLVRGGLPRLTLGGYLMRQFRLLALPELLDAWQKERLESVVLRFNQALVEKVVRLEVKAHREIEARIRQWAEYLKDLAWEGSASIASYPSAVETRAMIAAIVEALQAAPYQLQVQVLGRVALLDANLRRHWKRGSFVWQAEWAAAYPPGRFWWLYGRPQRAKR